MLRYILAGLFLYSLTLTFVFTAQKREIKRIENQYSQVMILRTGGRTLKGAIKPGTFSVFKRGEDRVACVVLR
jgi:hypothetical protein